MERAPAAGAVFRARAENRRRLELGHRSTWSRNANVLDARAGPATIGAGVLPDLVVWVKPSAGSMATRESSLLTGQNCVTIVT